MREKGIIHLFLACAALLFSGFSQTGATQQAECATAPARHSYDRSGRPGRDSAPESVCIGELPFEARETLALIKQGGPFLYPEKDGSIFGNRERLLPQKPKDYYREYTVKTPDSGDRRARRIVAGRGGEYYYTGDHYRSFRRVLE
jgi:ribonuclease T1